MSKRFEIHEEILKEITNLQSTNETKVNIKASNTFCIYLQEIQLEAALIAEALGNHYFVSRKNNDGKKFRYRLNR